MTSAKTYGLGLVRDVARLFTIEADVREGLPETTFVGLPDIDLRETRDRVRAAIINSKEDWPAAKIAIKLSPKRLPASTSSLDLAVATAVLAVAGGVSEDKLASTLFVAELGLDGQLRPAPGIRDVLSAIGQAGLPELPEGEGHVFVAAAGYGTPIAQTTRTNLRPTVSVVEGDHLRDIVAWLRGSVSPTLTFL